MTRFYGRSLAVAANLTTLNRSRGSCSSSILTTLRASASGKIDVINAMTGNDLVEFVDNKLFPFLKSLKATAASTNSLEFKIGEIFDELHNKIKSGFNLREVINMIDELHFESADDKHEMTVLYENNIQRMGNAGRNGGEYYTPRPLIRSIVKVVDPKIGETVYDPACGSAGFLCEAFNYMEEKIGSTTDNDILQHSTFYGIEKKPLPYIIATMNMIFHGVSAPNIIKANTLAINLTQILGYQPHSDTGERPQERDPCQSAVWWQRARRGVAELRDKEF